MFRVELFFSVCSSAGLPGWGWSSGADASVRGFSRVMMSCFACGEGGAGPRDDARASLSHYPDRPGKAQREWELSHPVVLLERNVTSKHQVTRRFVFARRAAEVMSPP
ncbi:hypothetical protein GCM10009767_22140 [Kocuria aegyptia]|uniref:Secreted protein n=1 Tax=Kocuria aegyptia TaxID=330943 RepID=A0ABN2KQF1_9MICC